MMNQRPATTSPPAASSSHHHHHQDPYGSAAALLPAAIMPFAALDNCWPSPAADHGAHSSGAYDQPQPPLALPLGPSPHYHWATHLADNYVGFVKREEQEYPCSYVNVNAVGGGSGGGGLAARIGLNLGHRTYFSSGDALAIDRLLTARAHQQHLQAAPPRCQAEGCKADLSGAKHYHRRHKVCEFHSKASVVVAGGLQQRFCQQCSRFHVLSEFDESKRSCRKRLADHNRRRRKPQTTTTTTTNSNSSNKNKHSNHHTAPRPSRDPSSKCAVVNGGGMQRMNQGGGEHQQSKAISFRNGPALSLGGVGGSQQQQQQSLYNSNNYHQQGHFSSSSTSNNTTSADAFYHGHQQHHLFGSSSNSNEGGGGGGSSDTNNLLHLGQSMFEVDFM